MTRSTNLPPLDKDLVKSEERYRLLTEQAADTFFLHDLDGKILDVSQRTCEQLGYRQEELLGASVADIEVGVDIEQLRERWACLVTGGSILLEGRHRRQDGDTFPVEVHMRRFDHEGKPRVLTLARDISERKNMQDAGDITATRGSGDDIAAGRHAGTDSVRRERQLQILSEASQKVNMLLDIPQVMHALVESATELADARGGAAGLIEHGKMAFKEYYRDGRWIPFYFEFEEGRGVPGWVIKTHETYVTNDAKHDPHVIPEIRRELGFRNLVNVPILSRSGDILGCFEIHDDFNGRPFDHQDVGMLEGLAASAAVAIQNAAVLKQYREVERAQRRYSERLKIINQLHAEILATNSPKEIARIALNRIRKLLPAVCGCITSDTPGESGPVVLAEMGAGNARDCTGSVYGTKTLVFKRQASGEQARPVLIELAPRLTKGHHRAALRYCMQLPLTVQEDVVGSLHLAAAEDEAFSNEHANIAREVADSVAIAIRQTHLYEEAQQNLQELERRVRERTAELSAINRELQTFSYSVSHDLRTPLHAIKGFSEILTDQYGDSLDETTKNYLDRISKLSSRMSDLIDGLLRLSNLTRCELHWQNADLSRQANEVISELRDGQPDREVEVIIEPNITVQGDINLLRCVLANLLENAWKYTVKVSKPVIRFGTHQKNGQPVYFVSDNGVGFDMNNADRLFGPFQRMHRKDDFPGTGIGLATAQRIVDRHGGQIWAEAEPGKGARFSFTLA